MKPNRIALALVLTGLAAPAFAEKCVGSCDFNNEPLIVTPTKKSSGTGTAPTGLTTAPAMPARSSAPGLSEILITKSSDISSEPLLAPASPLAAPKGLAGPKAALPAAPATHVMKGATIPQNAPVAGPATRR